MYNVHLHAHVHVYQVPNVTWITPGNTMAIHFKPSSLSLTPNEDL
jgi:hypothetical protein